jgi:hypothetical protein
MGIPHELLEPNAFPHSGVRGTTESSGPMMMHTIFVDECVAWRSGLEAGVSKVYN